MFISERGTGLVSRNIFCVRFWSHSERLLSGREESSDLIIRIVQAVQAVKQGKGYNKCSKIASSNSSGSSFTDKAKNAILVFFQYR